VDDLLDTGLRSLFNLVGFNAVQLNVAESDQITQISSGF
jgi:hypothetical protein